VIPAIGRWRRPWRGVAVPVPGRDKLVYLSPLECHILAGALWDLARPGHDPTEGTIRLTPGPGRYRQDILRIEWGVPAEGLRGLEGRLLAGLPTGGTALSGLVTRCWAMSEGPLPLNAVIVEAQIEAMNLGVIERPQTPKVIPGRPGRSTFPKVFVHPSRLAALRRPFLTLAARWAEALRADPVAEALLKGCRDVLRDARPQITDAGPG
jgi:hypothetical protein